MRIRLFILIVVFSLISCAEKEDFEAADMIACGDFDGSKYFCDARDKTLYKYVRISGPGQVWMAENLKFDTNSEISTCYNYDCDTYLNDYGRLYLFDENYLSLCPAGWRIPTEADWAALELYARDEELKSKESWDGTDDYGFNALPAGVGLYSPNCLEDDNGILQAEEWYGIGLGANSVTAFMSDNVLSRRVLSGAGVLNVGCLGKNSYTSVRCIKE